MYGEMKMTNNRSGDDCVEPATGSSFLNEESEDADASLDAGRPMSNKKRNSSTKQNLESPPSNKASNRLTPTSTSSTKTSPKPTFASDFVTPGTIVDDSPGNSRKNSIASMNGLRSQENKKSFTSKSKSKRATSADAQPVQQQEQMTKKRSNEVSQSESETMQAHQAHQEKFREAFLIFDRDGDGRITRAEMTRAMQTLGYQPSDEEISNMLDKADINRNGTVEFEEFIQVVMGEFPNDTTGRRQSIDQEMQAMFEIFDLNKDGRITAQELSQVMHTLGEKLSKSELDDMMRTADVNGDGIIDFQEFQDMFQGMFQDMFKTSGGNTMAVTTH